MPNNPLDQDAVNLAKSIRKIESNDNFQARGQTGEYGAYQFMPDTWKQWSGKYLGRDVPLERATKEEQNEVAYKKIKEMKDKGYNVGQIASSWNAGEGRKDAYLTGFKGVNDKGVSYDTGAYAKKVAEYYQQIKGGTPQAQASTGYAPPIQNSMGYAPPTMPTHQPIVEESSVEPEKKGIGRKIAEFAFPILEKKERTPLQAAADVGLSALSLVPGLGLAGLGGKVAIKGAGAALKGVIPIALKGSGIAKGAGAGYGVDVLSNVSQGETGAGAFTPGLGAVLGGAGGAALNKLGKSKIGQEALDADALKKATSIVSPPMNKKNIKQSLRAGLGGRSGGLVTLNTDSKTQRAAESIKDLVKRKVIKESDTVEKKANAVLDEIGTVATNLETRLGSMEVVPILSRSELDGLLKKTLKTFEESPILVGDAGVTAKRIFDQFVRLLPKGKDITALDLLKARKQLDAWIKKEGRSAAFDPRMETAISRGLREIRQGANDLIEQKAPDVPVKEMLRQQSAMYDALENIIETGYKEVGTSRTGRYFQRHPYQREAIKGLVAASVPAGVSSYLTAKAVGD